MDGIIGKLQGRVAWVGELQFTPRSLPLVKFGLQVFDPKQAERGLPLEHVQVAVFGAFAEELAGQLARGQEAYCEGTLRLDRWRDREGAERYGLSLSAWQVTPIGQAQPRRRAGRAHAAR